MSARLAQAFLSPPILQVGRIALRKWPAGHSFALALRKSCKIPGPMARDRRYSGGYCSTVASAINLIRCR
ncbi:hypothetical protein KCP78_15570 [Salmonella enterica subsp. enterica]|nr:hypothetical protein KCP78_15570 [Salmonella enterica subsp. enterica]